MAIIQNIVDELDLLVNKYAVSIEELKSRRKEDSKIFNTIEKKGFKTNDKHYLNIDYAISQIPTGEVAQALLQDFKDTARRNNLFSTDQDVSTGLVDLSGYKLQSEGNNIHSIITLSPNLKIEPSTEDRQFKFTLKKRPYPVQININEKTLKNNLNGHYGYEHTLTILDYDITTEQIVKLHITEGTRKTTHNIRLPKLTQPNPLNVLTFTQTIPFGTNNDVRQQIKHNGGAGPNYKKQELNVKVGNTTYNGAQSVGSQFPSVYNSFSLSSKMPAVIIFNHNTNEPNIFNCEVNWNSKYNNIISNATPANGSGSYNYCFLRLMEDNLYIISGINNAGNYSFSITSPNNEELVRLVKDNPNTPFLVMLFRNGIPPAYTTYRLFKDL